MPTRVVIPTDLNTEFDMGVSTPNKISVKIDGSTLKKNASGVIAVDASALNIPTIPGSYADESIVTTGLPAPLAGLANQQLVNEAIAAQLASLAVTSDEEVVVAGLPAPYNTLVTQQAVNEAVVAKLNQLDQCETATFSGMGITSVPTSFVDCKYFIYDDITKNAYAWSDVTDSYELIGATDPLVSTATVSASGTSPDQVSTTINHNPANGTCLPVATSLIRVYNYNKTVLHTTLTQSVNTTVVRDLTPFINGGNLLTATSQDFNKILEVNVVDQCSNILFEIAYTVPAIFADIYSYTGADQIATTPSWATSATVKAWGAAGGGESGAIGGAGGYSEIELTSLDLTYSVMVGQGGFRDGTSVTYGYGGADLSTHRDGSAGGLSGLFTGISSILNTDQPRALIVAGGGGAAGYLNNYGNVYGYSGNSSNSGGMPTMQGQNDLNGANGVAGGGGYFGGNYGNYAGGNGGSGYAPSGITLFRTGGNTTPANISPNTTDPYYAAGIGSALTETGGNGRVVIIWKA